MSDEEREKLKRKWELPILEEYAELHQLNLPQQCFAKTIGLDLVAVQQTRKI